jgi:hypothetical protein
MAGNSGGVHGLDESDAPTVRSIGSEPSVSARPQPSNQRMAPLRPEPSVEVSSESVLGGREQWKLLLLMAVEASFALSVVIWTKMEATDVLRVAAQATGFAIVAVFAKPSVVHIGYWLRLVKSPKGAPSGIPYVLIATIMVELSVVLVTVGLARYSPDQALQLAGALTALCMSVVYLPAVVTLSGRGRGAVLVLGRRLVLAAARRVSAGSTGGEG